MLDILNSGHSMVYWIIVFKVWKPNVVPLTP